MRSTTCLLLFVLISIVSHSQDTISVMYYNLLNYPGSTPERSDTLLKIVQYIQPDILVVNELISEVGADLILNSALNQYGIQHYKRAEFVDGYNTDNMLFYDSTSLRLHSQSEIGTQLRDINEYILYTLPVGTDTTFLNIYSAHLKASQGSSNVAQRTAEVKALKDHLDQRTGLENVIFGGDMNIYTNFEAAYDTITSGGYIDLFDPINTAGDWHDNSFYADIHTQSTRTAQFGGGASGGMDDRFDMIFISDDIQIGSNDIKYIPDSYYAVGQDGFRFNGSLISPTNTSEPDSVISSLYYMSDHLPVVMKLEITSLLTGVDDKLISELDITVRYSQGKLRILNIQEPQICYVFDSSGRLIKSQRVSEYMTEIEMPSNTISGIYHYSIYSSKSRSIKSGRFLADGK
jgi:endonuclease/exonuclease/phosphatase family metal-dependent hydrolase